MRQCGIIFLVLTLLLVFTPVTNASVGAFLILDARDGLILDQEGKDLCLPMASTTKIMTALVALEQVSLSEMVKIPRQAVGTEGSSLYLTEGKILSVEDLLYGLMLRSANDCAEALAWYIGDGDRDRFIAMMNQKAKSLGLSSTCFKNPSGLPEDGHYTTAYELALIMREAMKCSDFQKITSTKSRKIGDQMVVNHNKLLSLYENCVGGKTGYTMEAGRCLVTVAKKDGVSLICVTLGRRDDWNIHATAYGKWFGNIREIMLEEKGTCRVDLPIAGGGVALAENSSPIMARLFSPDQKIEKVILAPRYLYGAKRAGEVVGTIEYRLGGTLIGESPLILKVDIHENLKKELFISRIFRFFRQIILKNK